MTVKLNGFLTGHRPTDAAGLLPVLPMARPTMTDGDDVSVFVSGGGGGGGGGR